MTARQGSRPTIKKAGQKLFEATIVTNNFRPRMVQLFLLIVLLVIGTLCVRPINAQTDTAQIQGTVHDSTGAVIRGAKITVTNVDTGAVSTATSDSSGSFTVNALVRGHYSAEVKATGFDTAVQNLTLDLSQVQALEL